MAERADLYAYGRFADGVLHDVRLETFGIDIGQNSWVTADEYDRFVAWLGLDSDSHVLEVASGSGGPALHLARTAGCRVTGIDASESGVAAAQAMAARSGESAQVQFQAVDANARLPFEDDAFDGLLCVDSMNHFPDRPAVLREWRRIVRPGRRAVFTDPVVITGPVTDDELALRSSIGRFVFVPSGVNEQLVSQAGLRLVRQEDVTENAALVSGRWHRARNAHREALVAIEGEEDFEGLQRFFAATHQLARERRLSRIAYVAEKAAG